MFISHAPGLASALKHVAARVAERGQGTQTASRATYHRKCSQDRRLREGSVVSTRFERSALLAKIDVIDGYRAKLSKLYPMSDVSGVCTISVDSPSYRGVPLPVRESAGLAHRQGGGALKRRRG